MFTLYKKELSSFFSSLIGYLTIIVFLVLTGLMLWVFKGDFNILDYGFAGMDGLFIIGPFLYLFLIPAITMRMFAEEKKNGTIELLLTKPLSEMTLIWAKFLAGLTLVLISLLPTLVCYFSVYALGDPVGNIDTGSVAGSYIGLLMLGVDADNLGHAADDVSLAVHDGGGGTGLGIRLLPGVAVLYGVLLLAVECVALEHLLRAVLVQTGDVDPVAHDEG